MRTRTFFLVATAVVAAIAGVVKTKHTPNHAITPTLFNSHSTETKNKEKIVGEVAHEVHLADPVMVDSSLASLQEEMSRLSNDELKQIVTHSGDEIRKNIAADPMGVHRSDADTKRIALALDRQAAARILLISRKLDLIRGKYL